MRIFVDMEFQNCAIKMCKEIENMDREKNNKEINYEKQESKLDEKERRNAV